MEPAIIEMNVPVAITVIIGMIGTISWFLAKNFEEKFRVNPTMAGDGVVGIEYCSAEMEAVAQADEAEADEAETEEVAGNEDTQEVEHADEEEEEKPADEVEADAEKEEENVVKMDTNVQTDIDTLHEKIEEMDNRLEVTRNLVTELCQTVIDTNNSTKTHFNKTLDALDAKTTSNVQDIAYSTATNLSTFRQSVEKMGETVTSVQNSLGDYARTRDITELKTQLEEILKRSTVQKSVYQAWNGASKWTDFNDGELNIQMIRKKFMTTEQNEEWLLPENKKIAAYNRDQLLGLNEDTWTTTDNTVFVKRYYKDDWDSSIEVAITVTLSKKILVPPGGKPETIITHILKRLSEKEQITWEHLLVNV